MGSHFEAMFSCKFQQQTALKTIYINLTNIGVFFGYLYYIALKK